MTPLVEGKNYSALPQLIYRQPRKIVLCSALLFAIVAILVPLARAQRCDYTPDNLTFSKGSPFQQCVYIKGQTNFSCVAEFSYNNRPGNTPNSYCSNHASLVCSERAGMTCNSFGNSSCGAIVDTWKAIGDNETYTVTTLGIGGPSCKVPKSVPSGIGPAGTPTNPQSCYGDPVSTGNGNYYYQHTDLSINDHIAGLPLVFQRAYNSLMRNHIVPAAQRAGITNHLNWHVFRHTFSTLLASNGEDVKTVQSLLRHANPSITLVIYTHAVSRKKREAQSRVVEMVLPPGRKAPIVVPEEGIA
jgi:hypothetical protein